MSWLSAVGAFLAVVLPLVVGMRFTRSARLRRKLEQDAALMAAFADVDDKVKAKLSEVALLEATELMAVESRGGDINPLIWIGPGYIALGVLELSIDPGVWWLNIVADVTGWAFLLVGCAMFSVSLGNALVDRIKRYHTQNR